VHGQVPPVQEQGPRRDPQRDTERRRRGGPQEGKTGGGLPHSRADSLRGEGVREARRRGVRRLGLAVRGRRRRGPAEEAQGTGSGPDIPELLRVPQLAQAENSRGHR